MKLELIGGRSLGLSLGQNTAISDHDILDRLVSWRKVERVVLRISYLKWWGSFQSW